MAQDNIICMNGKLIPEGEALIHVLSPAAKYGATVFEGICAYWNKDHSRMNVFRLDEHVVRLRNSIRILRFDCDVTNEQFSEVVGGTIAANGYSADVHIRLSVWVSGRGPMESRGPTEWMCAVLPRGERSIETRLKRAAVSSWRRIDDTSMPPRVKTAANYNNGRLAQIQALLDGYDEALLLGADGKVAEGTGACFVMVRDGAVVTPPITSGILESVTRATILELARKAGFTVQERAIDRTELYTAEEAFLCGSAYEVTPVVSIDQCTLGGGKIGPVTRALWDLYSDAFRGGAGTPKQWLTPVKGLGSMASATRPKVLQN